MLKYAVWSHLILKTPTRLSSGPAMRRRSRTRERLGLPCLFQLHLWLLLLHLSRVPRMRDALVGRRLAHSYTTTSSLVRRSSPCLHVSLLTHHTCLCN